MVARSVSNKHFPLPGLDPRLAYLILCQINSVDAGQVHEPGCNRDGATVSQLVLSQVQIFQLVLVLDCLGHSLQSVMRL